MELLNTDDQFTIVNRSKEHKIAKKLIRKVPYFEKMLNHEGLLESKTNKVVLDFDEKVLKLFLDWLKFDNVFIDMSNVIHLYNIADYFGIKNHLLQKCANYFHEYFEIEHLSVVIPQVTPVSELMNSTLLNVFICRYFLKIVNTNVWLLYPIETVEYMCSLDLIIHSEYQVFDAIMKWLKANVDSRKCFIKRLLKLVRWCHLDDESLSEMEKQVLSLQPQPSESPYFRKRDCELNCNRNEQEYFIGIYELDVNNLRVLILDRDLNPLVEQIIKLNPNMTISVFHHEHVSDIFFDSGSEMIRIDWKSHEYRRLTGSQFKSYLTQIFYSIQDPHSDVVKPLNQERICLSFEAVKDYMFTINNTLLIECWPADAELFASNSVIRDSIRMRATILGNNIYFLSDYNLAELNMNNPFKMTYYGFERFGNKLSDKDLIITSRKANDDRVIFIDPLSKDAFCFNVKTRLWNAMGHVIDNNLNSTNQNSTSKLLTLTSIFISMDTMNTCLNH